MAPLILSVGMPVYNGERYLASSLDSILAQTYAHFELIISDNASTDATQDICRAYAARDSRIRYYRSDRNMGASWNFNRVYALRQGTPFYKQAAHDDICEPTFFERCMAVLGRDSTVVMAYPRTIVIDGDGNELERKADTLNLQEALPHKRFQHFHHVFGEQSICHPVFGIIRVAALRDRHILPPYIASDMILLAELALHGKIAEIPEYLFKLRWHAGASTVANKAFDLRAVWFDPSLRGSLAVPLTRYRWLYEYAHMSCTIRGLTPYQRIRCLQQLPRWIYRQRGKLATDATLAAALAARYLSWHPTPKGSKA